MEDTKEVEALEKTEESLGQDPNAALTEVRAEALRRTSEYNGAFERVQQDVIRMIAATDVFALLKLARTNRYFTKLMREERTWQALFQKTFPVDFAFCNGQLPLYVVTEENHPFSNFFQVYPYDRPGWKRFYLKTRDNYHRTYSEVNRNRERPLFERQYEEVMEMLNGEFGTAQIVWRFLWMFKTLIDGKHEISTSVQAYSTVLQNLAELRREHRWIEPYLAAMPTQGNDSILMIDKFLIIHQGRTHQRIPLMTENVYRRDPLFTAQHRKLFEQLCTERIPTYTETIYDFMRTYDVLARTYSTRCVTSMNYYGYHAGPLSGPYMAMNAKQLKETITTFKGLNPSMGFITVFNICKLYLDPLQSIVPNVQNEVIYELLSFRVFFEDYLRAPRVIQTGGGGALRIMKTCISCGLETRALYCCGTCKDTSQAYCGDQCATGHRCK